MVRFYKRLLFPSLFVILSVLLISALTISCKSKPTPKAGPVPSIIFERIEADAPVNLKLFFFLNIENPFPSAGQVKIDSWQVEINGKKASSGFTLGEHQSLSFMLRPGSNSFPLELNMDIDVLTAQGLAPADDYNVNLIAKLNFTFETAPPLELEVSGIAVFPGVQTPIFSITDIAILKAELINTRFRVSIKINNPNPFPVELSAFGYELYGNGRLWADGSEKNIIRVEGRTTLKGDLYLIMNFINMKRNLLDQIINLIDVNYRFTGEAQVSTEVEYLPKFTTSFNLSGYSVVLEN